MHVLVLHVANGKKTHQCQRARYEAKDANKQGGRAATVTLHPNVKADTEDYHPQQLFKIMIILIIKANMEIKGSINGQGLTYYGDNVDRDDEWTPLLQQIVTLL